VEEHIMMLNTMDDISTFFHGHLDVIFIVDQLNALERTSRADEATAKEKADVRRWLRNLGAHH
jgi:hypothetical protein